MKRNTKPFDKDRPLWETPERLFGISTIRTAECADQERPNGLNGNPSHVKLGTEEELHRKAPRLLDFVGEVLGLQAEGPWRWQRPFLKSLFRMFFGENSNAPAWVMIVPLRMPHEGRFGGRKLVPHERNYAPVPIGTQHGLSHGKISLRPNVGEIDTKELLMEYPKLDGKSRPYLMHQSRVRTITGDAHGESVDWLVYLADPGGDRDRIAKAHVPSISQYYDSKLGLLTTASMTLAKLEPSEKSDVTQLIITLQPQEGFTAAITTGDRSLETYCRQYPIDETLLTLGADQ